MRSAAYGSDALSGVVNFVIDHDFTGFKGEVQTGMTKYEDDKSISAQLSYGTPFADGRGHLLMSGEYTKSEGIEGTNDRPWARLPAAVILNPAYAAGNGQPRYVVRRDVGLAAGTPGGIITTGPLRGTYFGPNGQINRNFNFGTNVGNNFQEGGDWQYSRIENGIDISGEVERAIGYVRTSYDLTDNVSAYLEGQYSDTSTDEYRQSEPPPGQQHRQHQQRLPAGVAASGNDQCRRSTPRQATFMMGSTNADMGQLVGDYSRSLYRIAGGLDGSFGAFGTDWTWNTLCPTQRNRPLAADLSQRHHAELSEGDQIPSWSTARRPAAVNADANPANDDPACVPYNVFGIGVNSQAALDYVMGVSVRDETLGAGCRGGQRERRAVQLVGRSDFGGGGCRTPHRKSVGHGLRARRGRLNSSRATTKPARASSTSPKATSKLSYRWPAI